MKITRKIEIDSPASVVWSILYRHFDRADVWMSTVKNSYALEGAEDRRRICELTDSEDGFSIVETITYVDAKRKVFSFTAMPFNAHALFPIQDSEITIAVQRIDGDSCRVIWSSEPNLSLGGVLLSPFLRYQFKNEFQEVLEELKLYMEQREVV